MSNKIEKLEFKKFIQEYNFLLIDDEYKQEVISENKTEFLERIQNLKKELGLIYDYEEDSDENEINPNEDSDKLQKKSKIDSNTINQPTKDKIKKLYREIAKKTHPDRTKSEKLINFYLKATTAADEYNLCELFIICIELGIDIDIDKLDREFLIELINMKKNELKNIELSFIWLYANSTTEEDKHKLVELFAQKHVTKK